MRSTRAVALARAALVPGPTANNMAVMAKEMPMPTPEARIAKSSPNKFTKIAVTESLRYCYSLAEATLKSSLSSGYPAKQERNRATACNEKSTAPSAKAP